MKLIPLAFLITYTITVFISFEPNPVNWGIEGRFAYIFASVMLCFPALMFVTWEEESS